MLPASSKSKLFCAAAPWENPYGRSWFFNQTTKKSKLCSWYVIPQTVQVSTKKYRVSTINLCSDTQMLIQLLVEMLRWTKHSQRNERMVWIPAIWKIFCLVQYFTTMILWQFGNLYWTMGTPKNICNTSPESCAFQCPYRLASCEKPLGALKLLHWVINKPGETTVSGIWMHWYFKGHAFMELDSCHNRS